MRKHPNKAKQEFKQYILTALSTLFQAQILVFTPFFFLERNVY